MPGGDGLVRLAKRAEQMQRRWPADAADIVDQQVTRNLMAATGNGSFSHGPRMGRARVDVRTGNGKASVTAGGSRAVWTIAERGTSPHVTDAGQGRTLRTPFGPRRKVRVAGVAGKRAWSSGVDKAMPQVRRSARDDFRKVVG